MKPMCNSIIITSPSNRPRILFLSEADDSEGIIAKITPLNKCHLTKKGSHLPQSFFRSSSATFDAPRGTRLTDGLIDWIGFELD